MNNHKDGWTGRVSDLHNLLTEYVIYKDAKTAPKAPNKLSGHLRRIRSSVRVQGINIQEARKTEKGSVVSLQWIHPDDNLTIKGNPDDSIIISGVSSGVSSGHGRVNERPMEGKIDDTPDDTDDTLHDLSVLQPQLYFEKEEEKEGERRKIEGADKVGKVSSGSSVSSSTSELPPEEVDTQQIVDCANRFDGYLCGDHEPATYNEVLHLDNDGREWCSKCLDHCQLMNIGERLGYPAIMRGKKAKDIFVKAGQAAWLETATKWGHEYTKEALALAQLM
jgi:hypothetical protein